VLRESRLANGEDLLAFWLKCPALIKAIGNRTDTAASNLNVTSQLRQEHGGAKPVIGRKRFHGRFKYLSSSVTVFEFLK
jgi:hypothetical protein